MKRIAFALLLLLAACGGDDDTPTDTSTTTTSTTTAFATTDVSTPEDSVQGQLTDVRVGAHEGFVRVVFTFSNLVPGYSVTVAQPPFIQDGSGTELHPDGEAFVSVRLTARAHDDDGNLTVPNVVTFPESSIQDVLRVGDFEGVVAYVIGLDKQRPFKVFTLSSPARLVIDIQGG